MDGQQTYLETKKNLSNRWWRLNNLYYIKDKAGIKIKFKPNIAQTYLYTNLHYFNVILKARQLGFTTFIMIYFLDACLFNSNHTAGVIAQSLVDANDLFKNKIKFAYDNLPEQIRETIKAKSDNARMLEFSNGSQLYTGTSMRGGTFQKLHVTEYGKISSKFPEKAKEIRTGAFNAIAQGQQIFVESTAEGKVGEFYDLFERARKIQDVGRDLLKLEPKLFFFAWYQNPEYRLTDDECELVVISDDLRTYFKELEVEGVELTHNQQCWYAVKADEQGDDMSQEYPSTPSEAFQGSLKGAFYTKQMKHVRANKQIKFMPYNPKYPVYTFWDLGVNDMMTILFYQYIDGRDIFIDYHEASGEGWAYYASVLTLKGYNYKCHYQPHDGNNRVMGQEVKTNKQGALDAGIRPIKVVKRTSSVISDIKKNCMPILQNCFFHSEKCQEIIKHLDNYRRKWLKELSMYSDDAVHDESSHGCDAFRTFAMAREKLVKEIEQQGNEPPPERRARPQGGSWMG